MTWPCSSVPEEEGIPVCQFPQALCLEVLQGAWLGHKQGGHKLEGAMLQGAASLRKLDQGGAVQLNLVGRGRGRGRDRGGALGVDWSWTWAKSVEYCIGSLLHQPVEKKGEVKNWALLLREL